MAGLRLFMCVSLIWTLIFFAPMAHCKESFRLTSWGKFLVGYNWGYVGLTGSIRIPAGGQPGSATRVQVKEYLGISAAETVSIFMIGEIFERHLITFDYEMFKPTAVQRIDHDFKFHNKTYEKGAMVETKLDFNWLRAAYTIRFLKWPTFSIGQALGVHHIRHGLTMNAETAEVGLLSNTRRLDGAYPTLGLELLFKPNKTSDIRCDIEGIHMVSRGYLGSLKFQGQWNVYPDVHMTASLGARTVHFIETNQPLNNEWSYNLINVATGVGFTF